MGDPEEGRDFFPAFEALPFLLTLVEAARSLKVLTLGNPCVSAAHTMSLFLVYAHVLSGSSPCETQLPHCAFLWRGLLPSGLLPPVYPSKVLASSGVSLWVGESQLFKCGLWGSNADLFAGKATTLFFIF